MKDFLEILLPLLKALDVEIYTDIDKKGNPFIGVQVGGEYSEVETEEFKTVLNDISIRKKLREL